MKESDVSAALDLTGLGLGARISEVSSLCEPNAIWPTIVWMIDKRGLRSRRRCLRFHTILAAERVHPPVTRTSLQARVLPSRGQKGQGG